MKPLRKCDRAREEMVKDMNNQFLRHGEYVRKCAEYFAEVLTMEDDRKTNADVFCDRRMSDVGELNEGAIELEEVREVLNLPKGIVTAL